MTDRKPRVPGRPTSSGKGRRPRAPRTSVPVLQPPVVVTAEASVGDLNTLPSSSNSPVAATTGDTMMTWMQSNKGICWTIFWIGWFFISPTTIIPGGLVGLVTLVFLKERGRITVVTLSAAWLTGLAYFLLTAPKDMAPLPVSVAWFCILTSIFALIVLGKRFPLFGWFLIIMITSAFSRGRRRW